MASQEDYTILLHKLDEFIRKYYKNKIYRGLIYVAALVASFFLIITALEYFNHFNATVRTFLFYSFILISTSISIYYILLPLAKYFQLGPVITHERAAQIIGDHFPQVSDKLLNTLQLQAQQQKRDSQPLIKASINQKIQNLRPIPFQHAIDLSENKKYIKYAIIPLLLIGGLFLSAPKIITNSTYRLIKHQQQFEAPAPFHFKIKNKQLEAPQYENFTLQIETQGQVIPQEAFIHIQGHKYRLKKKDKNTFEYIFKNVKDDISFYLSANNINSSSYQLSVLPKPVLKNFEVQLNYPAYTDKGSKKLKDVGDLAVPVGTHITWWFKSENTDSLKIRFGDQLHLAQPAGPNIFQLKQQVIKEQPYTIYPSNQHISRSDSVQYYISVIPDASPTIQVKQFKDSLDQHHIYFTGKASDDYGLQRLAFKYKILGKNNQKTSSRSIQSTNIAISKGASQEQFYYTWNLQADSLQPGSKVKYFFEVWDNDQVHGSKSTRSQVMYLQKPSREEMEKLAEKTSSNIKENLVQTSQQAKQLQQESKQLKQNLLQKKQLSWEDRQSIKKLLEQQKELQKKMKKVQKKQKKLQEQQSSYQQKDPDVKKKQDQLEKMMEENIDKQYQKKLQELQKKLDQLNKKKALQELRKMEKSNANKAKDLERIAELFKQLQLEQKLKQSAKKLDTLAQQQKELSQKTGNQNKSTEELSKKQKDLNQSFEEMQKELKNIKEINKQLENQHDLKDTKSEQKEIRQQMKKSLQKLQKNQRKGAQQNQRKSSKKMKELSQKMNQMMQSMEKNMIRLNLQTVRQILDNLVKLSFTQEELQQRLHTININSPAYKKLMEDQSQVRNDMELVKDSLEALSKRVFQIQSTVDKEVREIDKNLDKSIKALEQRHTKSVSTHQQYTMTAMNNLAVLLDEMMQQMQKQLAKKRSGKQNCQKPGAGQSTPKLSKEQQRLNKQIKSLKKKMKKSGKSSQQLSKELARLARKQSAIRQKLREMKQKNKNSPGKMKNADKIEQQMEESEEDIVNKQLSHELIERQKKIFSRLLEAEKAMRKQKLSKKRKAQQPEKASTPEPPPAFKKYKEMKAQQTELYKTVPPSLRPYYKQLVEKYFNTISH